LDVSAVKRHGKGMVAKLETIDSRDDAAALVNSDIQIDAGQLPELEEGEVYWRDLIGLTVIGRDDQVLGQVKSLFETGANDVIVVATGKDDMLIPYVPDEIVLEIDFEQGQLKVAWDQDYLEKE